MSKERIKIIPSTWQIYCICGKSYSSVCPESDKCPYCGTYANQEEKFESGIPNLLKDLPFNIKFY